MDVSDITVASLAAVFLSVRPSPRPFRLFPSPPAPVAATPAAALSIADLLLPFGRSAAGREAIASLSKPPPPPPPVALFPALLVLLPLSVVSSPPTSPPPDVDIIVVLVSPSCRPWCCTFIVSCVFSGDLCTDSCPWSTTSPLFNRLRRTGGAGGGEVERSFMPKKSAFLACFGW